MTALPDGPPAAVRGRRRPGAVLGAVAAGALAVAVAVPLAWAASAASAGSATAVGAPLTSSSTGPVERPVNGVPTAPAAPALPVLTAAAPVPAVVAPAPAPVRVRVTALGIDAPVDAVGATPEGAVQVPDDGSRTGWWSPGAAPGTGAGSTVVVGHVDTPAGPGALFRLGSAEVGQDVVVLDAAGSERAYRVTSRAQVPKAELPAADLFSTTGPPRLVIISCGGPFDRTARHYADNVVVVAEPA